MIINEQRFFQSILATIRRHHPELSITQNALGRWEWSFRNVHSSEDFESIMECLAHHARWVCDQADLMVELSHQGDDNYPCIG